MRCTELCIRLDQCHTCRLRLLPREPDQKERISNITGTFLSKLRQPSAQPLGVNCRTQSGIGDHIFQPSIPSMCTLHASLWTGLPAVNYTHLMQAIQLMTSYAFIISCNCILCPLQASLHKQRPFLHLPIMAHCQYSKSQGQSVGRRSRQC